MYGVVHAYMSTSGMQMYTVLKTNCRDRTHRRNNKLIDINRQFFCTMAFKTKRIFETNLYGSLSELSILVYKQVFCGSKFKPNCCITMLLTTMYRVIYCRFAICRRKMKMEIYESRAIL